MTKFSAEWFRDLPLNDIDVTILTIETICGDDWRARDDSVERALGWTTLYYEENVRCLAADDRAEEFSPGLSAVLRGRYPGEPQLRVWADAEAFTRTNHL